MLLYGSVSGCVLAVWVCVLVGEWLCGHGSICDSIWISVWVVLKVVHGACQDGVQGK